MARGRMISAGIAEDEAFNSMSVDAQFVFMRTIPHLDRDGLISGNPVLLWSKVAPLLPEYSDKTPSIIREWTDNGFVISYRDGKRDVLFFINFRKNQTGMRYEKEAPSQFAPPPRWKRTAGGLVPSDDGNSSTPGTEVGSQKDGLGTDLVRPNDGVSLLEVEVEDQVEDQDQTRREGDVDSSRATPPSPSAPDDGDVVDQNTLELMTRWSSNKRKAVRVRMSQAQTKIVEEEPKGDPPSRVQPASPLEPTAGAAKVISSKNEKIIIPVAEWTEMMGVMLDGYGLRALADAGVASAKQKATMSLEILCRMSPKFRTKDGITALFASWEKARGAEYPTPKPEWLEEHASLYLAGQVRYQKRNVTHERRSRTGSRSSQQVTAAAEDLYPEYAKYGA